MKMIWKFLKQKRFIPKGLELDKTLSLLIAKQVY